MPEGRALYEQARRRALAHTGDPQRTGTQTPAQVWAAVDALGAPCTCEHANCLHEEGQRQGQKVAARCTIMTAAGSCGCKLFTHKA